MKKNEVQVQEDIQDDQMNGPVKVYYLSPEELAYYRSLPLPKKDHVFSYEKVRETKRRSKSAQKHKK